ncbi:MAG TPA: DUF997 family protein [Verrucomicrobiales bacterium]|nr:DUF997 family protein [Verrucomicrobiales bacterium]
MNPHDSLEAEEGSRFRQARREAIVIVAAALAFAGWVNGWCWSTAYGQGADPTDLLWGLPRWVVFGVALPWMAANVFTIWFALCFFKEDSSPQPSVPRRDR